MEQILADELKAPDAQKAAWDVFSHRAEPPQPNGVPDEFWYFPLPLPD